MEPNPAQLAAAAKFLREGGIDYTGPVEQDRINLASLLATREDALRSEVDDWKEIAHQRLGAAESLQSEVARLREERDGWLGELARIMARCGGPSGVGIRAGEAEEHVVDVWDRVVALKSRVAALEGLCRTPPMMTVDYQGEIVDKDALAAALPPQPAECRYCKGIRGVDGPEGESEPCPYCTQPAAPEEPCAECGGSGEVNGDHVAGGRVVPALKPCPSCAAEPELCGCIEGAVICEKHAPRKPADAGEVCKCGARVGGKCVKCGKQHEPMEDADAIEELSHE